MNSKKEKAIINFILAVILCLIALLIFQPRILGISDWELAEKAESNMDAFMKEDTYSTYGSDITLHVGTNDNSTWTYNKKSIACIDPHYNSYAGNETYQIGAVIDIDNPNGYTDSSNDHSGLNIRLPNGTVYHYGTGDSLTKRSRFIAWLVYYTIYEGGFVSGNPSSGTPVNQSIWDTYLQRNILCFVNYAPSVLGVFDAGVTDQGGSTGDGWQIATAAGVDYRLDENLGIYYKAKDYAENFKAGGIEKSVSQGEPVVEYTDTQSILGPYKIKKSGDASISSIEIIEKGGAKLTATVLNSSKQVIDANSIANETDFYLRVDKIVSEIESITLYGTAGGVKSARLLLLEGANNQRLSLMASESTGGSLSISLPIPPAEPKLIAYKYIKSISRMQDDGSYQTLFTLPDGEVPEITITNKGRNDATVSKVTPPDYSKYTEVNSNGQPVVYNNDKIQYAWVIYNIGPGASSPNATYTITDKPGRGLVIDDANGWTQSGSNYTKTITIPNSLAGCRGDSSPAYYTGREGTITFKVDKEQISNLKQEPILIQNNGSSEVEYEPPILVAYKYIKSISRMQNDGSYKILFTLEDGDIPKLTVKNKGQNNAEVSNVTYPDYSKYTEVNENGQPIVYDQDKIEYAWVIYNIGPGSSDPNTQYTLTDEPGTGLEIDDANGWTQNGSKYTKTITIINSIDGYKNQESPAYYTGDDTTITFKVEMEQISDLKQEPIIIKNNNSNEIEFEPPILVSYKYIKSISRKQYDGTYEKLFELDDTEVPQLTVKNKGKNNAEVSSVTYPDYSEHTEVNDDGQPIVYDGDKIEYAWVIYNIGPGNTTPNTEYTLTDKPDTGLVLDEANGWTQEGDTYTKTITIKEILTGYKNPETSPKYYTGDDTTITFRISLEEIKDPTQEPIIIGNNGTNNVEFHPPILVAYKYIKAIHRLELDGSYTTVFEIPESDKPILTLKNATRNDVYVESVKYPDYSKYTDEVNNGVPIVYDGDKVDYEWVIYNIGPGATLPGEQTYLLVDEPEVGLVLDEENGWTQNENGNYEKEITLTNSLPGLTSENNSPAYHSGTDTRIYFRVDAASKIENAGDTGIIKNNDAVPVELRLKISGILFFDHTTGKVNEENGYFDTESGDYYLENYKVTLYDNGVKTNRVAYTNEEGYYEFDNLDITHSYYVSFEYNGQIYEPTTYDCQATTDITKKSFGTDGVQNRQNFNKKFEIINGSSTITDRDDIDNPEFIIYAYSGPEGEGSRSYTANDTTETLRNINFGIKDREKFDLNLRKDLVNVEVSINGKSHTYEYPGGNLPLPVEIRGTDLACYERMIRKEDLAYNGSGKLQVYITYIIQIQNESVGEITGYVTDLNDYYDSSYTFVDSWDENNNAINWVQSGNVSGNGVTYSKMHTTSLANQGITDKKYIYVRFMLKDEAIKQLSSTEQSSTEDNLAEIAGYRNTYTNDRFDKNEKQISSAGEVAGLLDVDSKPDNMNPVSSEVQNFLKESRTEEYQNLSGEEKTKRSREVFEDDADSAPGLTIIPGEPRTLTGTVFEDSAIEEKLTDDNERIGDGELTGDDSFRVNEVKVDLIEVGTNREEVNNYYSSDDNIGADGNHLSNVSVRTNENGEYSITGYIPGDYILRFTYGDKECLIATQNNDEMYTGQDYKSTLYYRENYEGDDWYKNTTPRSNDATDNQTRREEVNSYSRTIQYSNATILDSDRSSSNIETLANETSMYAETATMGMQVEYLGDENAEYAVSNVDFGVIERPRTTIILNKNVEKVKLTAVDGTTIFDSSGTAPELTWIENKYNSNRTLKTQGLIEGTVDENLLYGSTAQVSYTYTITNGSEIDYNDLDYYEKGIKPDDSKLNKINVNKIIDYIPNVFQYNEEITKQNGEIIINAYDEITDDATGTAKPADEVLWQVKKTAQSTLDANEYRTSGNELLAESVFNAVNQNINEVIQFPGTDYPTEITSAINSDPTQSKGILAPGGEIKLKNALTVGSLISSNEDLEEANTPVENIAEIIQLTVDNGRRPYYEDSTGNAGESATTLVTEIPGNANPMDQTTLLELDTAISEEVHFIVPFGENRQLIIIIIAIIALGVLGLGVFIIKKRL